MALTVEYVHINELFPIRSTSCEKTYTRMNYVSKAMFIATIKLSQYIGNIPHIQYD